MNLLLKPLSCLLLPLAACAAAPQPAAAPARPNVLFIAVDDLRTALGCYGDPLAISPNIDRLAAQGRLFQHAYAQQAVCGPSRASLLTGKLPDNIGVWQNRNLFRDTRPDIVTLPQLFKNNGYEAIGLGKTFSGNPREEDPQSWTVPATLRAPGWRNYALPESGGNAGDGKGVSHEAADVPDDGYTDGKMADLAVRKLADFKARNQPFFLGVGFFKPHLPFNAPKKYWDLHDPAKFDLDKQAARVKDAPSEAYHEHRELGGYTDMPKNEKLTPEQARAVRHGYYACVSYIDAQVGKLLDALRQLGLEDNTIVVLWGDHGFSLGEVSRWCKGTNFELDTRVPLMMRTPGMAQPGVATTALVELVDIYPTLAELAGLKPPADLDGASLTAVLGDPDRPARDRVMSQFARPFKPTDHKFIGYSLRTDSHRYTRWLELPSRKLLAEELYDYRDAASVTRKDAYLIESANVAGDPANAELLARLRQQMDESLAARTDRPAKAGKAAGPKPEKKKKKAS